ncbi:hypothetical protein Tco_0152050 [Tanacetum coccineum]
MFTCTLAQYVAYKTNVAQQFTPQKHYRLPHPGQGILGPAPAIYASQPTPLPSAFSTMPLQDPTWHMDTGASSHLNFNASNLSTIFDKRLFPSVHVGDGKSIPVTNTGHSIIPSHHRPLHLHNVLVTPNIIKNLISVRQFTRDNNCTIEFDAFGFSVKDYLTRHILLRCDSSSDLYPVTKPSTSPIAFLSTSASTWHQRLGHPVNTSSTDSQMHNNIMAAGSKDRPPMLGPGRYSQWRSLQAVAATEGNPAIQQHTTIETVLNMTPENKEHFLSEKEAIFLLLTGIGDDIYSTVDACKTANEMWIAN